MLKIWWLLYFKNSVDTTLREGELLPIKKVVKEAEEGFAAFTSSLNRRDLKLVIHSDVIGL
ncbi:hypothetical protein [Lacrimispora sp.]|uniref:hypothetical protein n=1 Tax=Lacrimispora sp. TaxID=2719234 RepID=UPI0028A285E2|nr:hypothetical protein [Lacrimispora sp.]